MNKIFVFLYFIAPFIVVPYIAYKEENWYILFGIIVCFIGSFSAAFKPLVFYALTMLCIGFWFKSGFNIHQYITLFFFCLLGGFLFRSLGDEYEKLIRKENEKFDSELESYKINSTQLMDKYMEYKKENPDVEMTDEVLEHIKSKFFYENALKELKKIDGNT